jgi:hypothetical protein
MHIADVLAHLVRHAPGWSDDNRAEAAAAVEALREPDPASPAAASSPAVAAPVPPGG